MEFVHVDFKSTLDRLQLSFFFDFVENKNNMNQKWKFHTCNPFVLCHFFYDWKLIDNIGVNEEPVF